MISMIVSPYDTKKMERRVPVTLVPSWKISDGVTARDNTT